jgi:hypothetical protein
MRHCSCLDYVVHGLLPLDVAEGVLGVVAVAAAKGDVAEGV